VHRFKKKIKQPFYNSRRKKGDMKCVPYLGSTNFSLLSNLILLPGRSGARNLYTAALGKGDTPTSHLWHL